MYVICTHYTYFAFFSSFILSFYMFCRYTARLIDLFASPSFLRILLRCVSVVSNDICNIVEISLFEIPFFIRLHISISRGVNKRFLSAILCPKEDVKSARFDSSISKYLTSTFDAAVRIFLIKGKASFSIFATTLSLI